MTTHSLLTRTLITQKARTDGAPAWRRRSSCFTQVMLYTSVRAGWWTRVRNQRRAKVVPVQFSAYERHKGG